MYGKPVFELQAHSPHRMSRRPRGISTRPSRAGCRLSWKGSMLPDAVLSKTCRLCKLSSGRLNKRKTTGGTWLGETRMYQDSAGGVRRPTPGKGGGLLGQACGLVESLENRGLVLKSASKLGAWEGPRVSLGGLVAESLDPTSVVSSILVDEHGGIVDSSHLTSETGGRRKATEATEATEVARRRWHAVVVTNREISMPMVHRALTARMRRSSRRDRVPRFDLASSSTQPVVAMPGLGGGGRDEEKRLPESKTGQMRCSKGRHLCRVEACGSVGACPRQEKSVAQNRAKAPRRLGKGEEKKKKKKDRIHQLEMPKSQLS